MPIGITVGIDIITARTQFYTNRFKVDFGQVAGETFKQLDLDSADVVKNAANASNNNNNKKKSILQLLLQQPPRKCNMLKRARDVAPQPKAIANSASVKEMADGVAPNACFKCGKCLPIPGMGCVCKACNLKWHFACLPVMFEKRYSSRRVSARNWMCESCSNASRSAGKKRTIADQTAAKANQMMTIDCKPATKIAKILVASDQNKQSSAQRANSLPVGKQINLRKYLT